jgi:hypothetical protein
LFPGQFFARIVNHQPTATHSGLPVAQGTGSSMAERRENGGAGSIPAAREYSGVARITQSAPDFSPAGFFDLAVCRMQWYPTLAAKIRRGGRRGWGTQLYSIVRDRIIERRKEAHHAPEHLQVQQAASAYP